MTIDNAEVVQQLVAAVQSLLPAVGGGMQRLLSVLPVRITPAGIGDLVAAVRDPEGDVLGRRVEALVVMEFETSTPAMLAPAVSASVSAITGANRAEMAVRGILRASLDRLSEKIVAKEGALATATQEIRFKILFEYRKAPVFTEETIHKIPVEMDIGNSTV
jgi:hypothetical protein